MAEVPTNVNGKHSVRFDPTIDLGHLVSAGMFLVCTGVAYASMDARVSKLEESARDLKVRDVDIVRESKDAVVGVEARFMREVTTQRAHMDQTQLRVAYDIREIKTLMRDGFRDLDQKLDKKADKPNR